MNCPFCNLDKKERVIWKGKHTFVILSDPRLMPGHILVVPKRHVERIVELNEAEKKELMEAVIKFQERILKRIAPGCDIRQHYQPFIKNNPLKVNHLHFHLQPRELYDELYQKCQIYHKDIFKPLTEKEAEKNFRLLK